MKTAVNLDTLRVECAEDLDKTFAFCAQIGLDGVELTGGGYSKGLFFGKTAAEVKACADKYGLIIPSALINFPDIEADPEEVIQFLKDLGVSRLVVPYIYFDDTASVMEAAAKLQVVVDRMTKEGIEVYWHNHGHELKLYRGRLLVDVLLEHVTGLKLEMDTFWAYAGGQEPLAFFESHKKYMNRMIHIKDGFHMDQMTDAQVELVGDRVIGDFVTRMIPCALGRGVLPIAELIKRARAHGIEWCILEDDCPIPDGFADVAYSTKPMTLWAKG